MPNYSRTILIGHLCRDTEVKFLPSGSAVAENAIAVTEKFKPRDGEAKESTMFIDIAVFGKGGEAFGQYATKGRAVMVDGRLRLDSWTDKDGNKRQKHRLMVDNWQLLGDSQGERRQEQRPAAKPQPRSTNALYEQAQAEGDDSGIPF